MYFTNSLLETPLRYKKKSSFTSLHLLTKVANANQHYNARMVISPTVSILKWPKNFQPCACRGKTSPKGIVIKVEDNLSALDLCFKMELARGFFFQRVDKLHHLCPTNPPPWESNSGRQGAKRKARLTGLAFAGFFQIKVDHLWKIHCWKCVKAVGKDRYISKLSTTRKRC